MGTPRLEVVMRRWTTALLVVTLTLVCVFSAWAQSKVPAATAQEQEKKAQKPEEGQRLENGQKQEEEQQPADDQEPEEESDRPPLRIWWDDGLQFMTLRDHFSMEIAGGAQNDSAAYGNTEEAEEVVGPITNGVEWRRARVSAHGYFAKYFEFKFQYDFAVNSPPNLKDAYLDFTLPYFPIQMRGGRFRAPISLEGTTGAMNTTFMERGLISAFLPSRNTGSVIHGDAGRASHRMRWAIGFIQPESDFNVASFDSMSISARFAYAFHPRREDTLWHVGIDYFRRYVDETIEYLERPESRLAPEFLDTGEFSADSADTAVLEGAIVRGPLSFQGEYAYTYVSRPEGYYSPRFNGFYIFGSYFLTGETRPYDGKNATFGRIHPTEEFFGGTGGVGALEVAVRYSHLDLSDRDIQGGELRDLTLGFNWYPTRLSRVMVNVIRAKLVDVDPVWIGQVRLQWSY